LKLTQRGTKPSLANFSAKEDATRETNVYFLTTSSKKNFSLCANSIYQACAKNLTAFSFTISPYTPVNTTWLSVSVTNNTMAVNLAIVSLKIARFRNLWRTMKVFWSTFWRNMAQPIWETGFWSIMGLNMILENWSFWLKRGKKSLWSWRLSFSSQLWSLKGLNRCRRRWGVYKGWIGWEIFRKTRFFFLIFYNIILCYWVLKKVSKN